MPCAVPVSDDAVAILPALSTIPVITATGTEEELIVPLSPALANVPVRDEDVVIVPVTAASYEISYGIQ